MPAFRRTFSLMLSPPPLSVSRARTLLGFLPNPERPPSKEQIQQAYRIAAKKYHPDSQNHHSTATSTTSAASATPNAELFRQCHSARELLLRHYHDRNRGIPNPGDFWDSAADNDFSVVSSMRNDIAFRVATMVFLTVACVYYDYVVQPRRRAHQPHAAYRQFLREMPPESKAQWPGGWKEESMTAAREREEQ